MGFQITFSNVLLALLYILPGFIICKMKKVRGDHLPSLSGVLIYACSPCMIVSAFLSLDFSVDYLISMGLFFVITLILQAAFMMGLFYAFRKKFEDARYRILTIGAVMGNVGFFGLPLVRSLLPGNPEAACYSAVYVVSMNVLVFTAGVYCLTKDKRHLNLKSAIVNPSSLSVLVALPLYILHGSQWMPSLLLTGINAVGSMTTPLCMIILGIRLATVSLKKLFTRPFVYYVCLAKLVIFPLFCYAAVYFLPLPHIFKISILLLSAVPDASIILNLAEIHRSETELAANCVLLSTLACLITIPLIMLLA